MAYNSTECCEGKTFTVGVVENMLFDLEMQNSTVINSSGYEFNVLQALATMLKFKFKIEGNTNYEFGNQLENKSWTGVIGKIQRKEIDFALAGLTVTLDRGHVTDFSQPYFNDEAAFYVKSNGIKQRLRVLCLVPFDQICWIFLIGISCTFLMLSLILSRDKPSMDTVLLLCADLLRQGASPLVSYQVSERRGLSTILRVWLMVIATVTTLYSCQLTSTTTSSSTNIIETLSELSKKFRNEEMVLGVRKGAFYMDYVMGNAEASQYGSVFRKSVKPVGGFDTYSHDLLNGKLAILTSAKLFSLYMSGKDLGHKVYKVKEGLFTEYVAIAFVKNFTYQSRFNFAVVTLREAGFLFKWQQILLSKADNNEPLFINSGFIDLKDLKSCLYLWVFGVCLAGIIAMKEMWVDPRNCNVFGWIRAKGNWFKF